MLKDWLEQEESESFLIPVRKIKANEWGGFAWQVRLPFTFPHGDSLTAPADSGLIVYEDGVVLGPAREIHSVIANVGGGTYSHWENYLIFSTSDNSDPRENGRTYSVEYDHELQKGLEQLHSDPEAPNQYNLFKLDVRDTLLVSGANVEELCAYIRGFAENNLSEFERYLLAEHLVHAAYPKYKFSEFGRIFLEDEEFLAFYKRFMDPNNWHSLDRKYTLNEMLKLVAHLEGDIAECGAYKGFSAHMMCRALQGSGTQVHLFDSFEGLSEPEALDGDYWQKGSLKASEAQLHETLAGFDNYRVYRGWIPERFNEVAERTFRFIHIDVDIYRPTLDSLSFFYPRLQASGIILLDDYGSAVCPGAKKAADEFFADKTEQIAMLPTGQAFTVKQ